MTVMDFSHDFMPLDKDNNNNNKNFNEMKLNIKPL